MRPSRALFPLAGGRYAALRDKRTLDKQKVAGQEIEQVEVKARPATTDLVATLKASLRKELAKAPVKAGQEAVPAKRPARRRASLAARRAPQVD
jgi:hypothetical protein